MTLTQYQIKIEHEKFGSLMKETFVDPIQFRLFLKMIQGCLELKNDLTFFNGVDFLVTGGVDATEQSIMTWLKAGAAGVGLGSKLITKNVLATKQYAELTATTKQLLSIEGLK